MNKIASKKENSFLSGRGKDLLWICVIAGVLLLTAFLVFGKEENIQGIGVAQMSEKEQKVCQILQEIEGVGSASVIVCEDEDEVKSVVVVCEGANDFRVVMDVREAVATALNTQQKSVKIYLKKDKRR